MLPPDLTVNRLDDETVFLSIMFRRYICFRQWLFILVIKKLQNCHKNIIYLTIANGVFRQKSTSVLFRNAFSWQARGPTWATAKSKILGGWDPASDCWTILGGNSTHYLHHSGSLTFGYAAWSTKQWDLHTTSYLQYHPNKSPKNRRDRRADHVAPSIPKRWH
jgi:hypothetical protein